MAVSRSVAQEIVKIAVAECGRIENKFSRFKAESVVSAINAAAGTSTSVDVETAALLNYADQCYHLSGGLFDITTGALSVLWKFTEDASIPDSEAIAEQLATVGWGRVNWDGQALLMPEQMQIDLGGIGKEYAVDRVFQLIAALAPDGVLVNFGGDIVASKRADGQPWRVGIEHPSQVDQVAYRLMVDEGAYATSGTRYRQVLKDGKSYSHIMNPLTGWPVNEPPDSVTVKADSCLSAGMLSTLAMLHGRDAEQFLSAQQVEYWCCWPSGEQNNKDGGSK